jgi:hypothetical protein
MSLAARGMSVASCGPLMRNLHRSSSTASSLAGAAIALAATLGCASRDDEGGNGSSREEALGQICEAQLAVSGEVRRSAPQPADVFGCWAVGTWTLHPAVVENGCADAPAPKPEYVFEVTRDDEERHHYRYLSDPTWDKVKMKVSSGGGGLCEGGFEIFSGDGRTVTRLKPSLEADGTVGGFGEYEVYRTSQL